MKKRILQIILAVAAILAAILGTNYWQKNYLAGVSTIQVPVPKVDVPPYTLLTADLFEMQEYPRALAGKGGYLLTTGDLEGRISAGVLLAGLPVPVRMAVQPEEFRLAGPAFEVISLPADAVKAAGAQIQIGEAINIYLLKPAPKQEQQDVPPNAPAPKPEVVLVARVPVVDVRSDNGQPLSSGADNSQPQPMKILVVAAPHEIVQAILEALALVEHEGAILWVTLATP
jgi:hypothetical protein